MPASTRSAALEKRSNRLKLGKGKRHWQTIGQGLAIGYQKTATGATWFARFALAGNKYTLKRIGIPDDHRDADGEEVLTYFQAQDKARELDRERREERRPGPYTVDQAVADYLEDWADAKSIADIQRRLEKHVLPKFKDRLVSDLTDNELKAWRRAIATSPAQARSKKDGPVNVRTSNGRARKNTANRILAHFKAALNLAYSRNKVPSDAAWRGVKPYRGVALPKVRYLTHGEAKRLLNACDADFRPLVQAALLTGCRYGELTALRVKEFDVENGKLYLADPKSGKPHHAELNAEGRKFFRMITAGRKADALLFTKADGTAWGRSHPDRRIKQASERANIQPPATFHILRHTFGAFLATAGVPLLYISELLGHRNPAITAKYYAHLYPNAAQKALEEHLPEFGGVDDKVVNLEAR